MCDTGVIPRFGQRKLSTWITLLRFLSPTPTKLHEGSNKRAQSLTKRQLLRGRLFWFCDVFESRCYVLFVFSMHSPHGGQLTEKTPQDLGVETIWYW